MNILIIDDEEDLLEILTNALKRANFTVTSAASSVDAMRALTSGEIFDIFISDRDIDGISGVDLSIQYQENNPNGIIAFMTGESRQLVVDEFQNRGGKGDIKIFEKPFERKDFKKWAKEQKKE